ncbi:NACHT domain-containing protein [Streptomyces sp. MN03-5084-2B]|nr:NACHT domain-containing protein [Streptomyces sp. MN03-5084-2B]
MVISVISSTVATTAAKAVVPLAVRASRPAWKKVVESTIFDPRPIKNLQEWSQVRSNRQAVRQVNSFLKGRMCSGLLETYAVSYASAERRTARARDLEEMFVAEFYKKVKTADAKTFRVAESIWKQLTLTVEKSVTKIRREGDFEPSDLVLLSSLTQVRPGGTPSDIDVSIENRKKVYSATGRVDQLVAQVAEIRKLSTEYYFDMAMPHAKENYRVNLEDLYVSRGLSQLASDWRSGRPAKLDTSAVEDVIDEGAIFDKRYLIVGNPGAGKSTYVRKTLLAVANDASHGLAPLVLDLKSWSEGAGTLAQMIAKRTNATLQIELTEADVADMMSLGLGFIVFDGLDEIVDVTDRRNLVSSIESFARRYPLAHIVVTARREGYQAAPLNNLLFPAYQFPDFTDEQMCEYVGKWFTALASHNTDIDHSRRAAAFIEESAHAAELRSNPLMLSLLCLLYDYEGYIPENRARVYEECAELMFGRWDRMRKVQSLVRTDARGHRLVEEIASYFFGRQSSQGGETETALKALIRDFVQVNVNEDEFEAAKYAQDFLDHCAGRAWLLTLTGSNNRNERLFGFTHRTFMEYFAACHIARSSANAEELAERLRPIIASGTSEIVCQLAVDRFDEKNSRGVDEALRVLTFNSKTLEIHINGPALAFCLSSLDYLQPTPRTVKSLIIAGMRLIEKDPSLATRLFPYEFYDKHHRVVSEVVDRYLNERPENKADTEAANGCRIYLAASKLNEPGDLRWLAQNARSILVEKCINKEISVYRYYRAGGPGSLINIYDDSGVEGCVPGPLTRALKNWMASGFDDEILRPCFAALLKNPRTCHPVHPSILLDLTDTISSKNSHELRQLFGADRLFKMPEMIGFGNLCILLAIESIKDDSPTFADILLSSGLGEQSDRAPYEIDSNLLKRIYESPRVSMNASWRKYLESALSRLPSR